jgi:hypothetical protein
MIGPSPTGAFLLSSRPEYHERSGKLDEADFDAAVRQKIEGLSGNDRLNAIRTYYEKPEKELTFIFVIEGLTGDEFDLELGPVNIYLPRLKRYIIERELDGFGKLAEENDKSKAFAQAASRVRCFDTESGQQKAIEQIESALDLVRCFYRPRASFRIVGATYVVGGNEGAGWRTSIEGDEVAYRRLEGLDLDRYKLDQGLKRALPKFPEFVFTHTQMQSTSERKVNYSLHWFRKGAESARSEDKILCYWIAIEHLFENDSRIAALVEKKVLDAGKIGLVTEVFSAMYIRSRMFELGWEFHGSLEMSYRFQQLAIPPALAAEAQLAWEEGKTRELRKFVAKLSEVATHVSGIALRAEIEHHIQLYGPADHARAMVQDLVEQASDELLLIYRYRNKIVHNAQFSDPLLGYFAQKAEKYAGWLVRNALRWILDDPQGSVSGHISRAYSKGKSYLAAMNSAANERCIDLLLSEKN